MSILDWTVRELLMFVWVVSGIFGMFGAGIKAFHHFYGYESKEERLENQPWRWWQIYFVVSFITFFSWVFIVDPLLNLART